jgi:hypothetical protein
MKRRQTSSGLGRRCNQRESKHKVHTPPRQVAQQPDMEDKRQKSGTRQKPEWTAGVIAQVAPHRRRAGQKGWMRSREIWRARVPVPLSCGSAAPENAWRAARKQVPSQFQSLSHLQVHVPRSPYKWREVRAKVQKDQVNVATALDTHTHTVLWKFWSSLPTLELTRAGGCEMRYPAAVSQSDRLGWFITLPLLSRGAGWWSCLVPVRSGCPCTLGLRQGWNTALGRGAEHGINEAGGRARHLHGAHASHLYCAAF